MLNGGRTIPAASTGATLLLLCDGFVAMQSKIAVSWRKLGLFGIRPKT